VFAGFASSYNFITSHIELAKTTKKLGQLWRPLVAEPGNLAVFAQRHVRTPFISFLLSYGWYPTGCFK